MGKKLTIDGKASKSILASCETKNEKKELVNAALRLIEGLCKEGGVEHFVFKNILAEYAGYIDKNDFYCGENRNPPKEGEGNNESVC